MQEREEPGAAVRHAHREEQRGAPERRGGGGQWEEGRARDVQHPDHDRRGDDRGAEVRLQHQEHPGCPQDDEDGPQRRSQISHAIGATRQQVGDIQQQRQLHQLGGLHAQRAVSEPALRAVHGESDSGEEHHDEQPEADEQHERREAPPEVVVDPERDKEGSEAEQRPDRLPVEVQPRRPVVVQRAHRRGRQHHHQADEVEDDDDGEQCDETARNRTGPRPGSPGGVTIPADVLLSARRSRSRSRLRPNLRRSLRRSHQEPTSSWTARTKSSPRSA